MRLDKWLWADRFFKTRGLAQAAVVGGMVKLNGERPLARIDSTAACPGLNATGDPEDDEEEEEEEKKPEEDEEEEENDGEGQEVPWQVAVPRLICSTERKWPAGSPRLKSYPGPT